jgi:hypothetical protein
MQKPMILRRGKRIVFPTLILIVALQCSFTEPVIRATTYTPIFKDTTSSHSDNNSNNYSVGSFVASKMYVFDSLHLEDAGLSKKVFEMALKGMARLIKTSGIRENIISIIDFSQPSINKRLYIIDLDNYELLFNTWVAHGLKSGKELARSFSNKTSSYKSSLGFYVTGEAYSGSTGYSMKLQGMEKGLNDRAMRRGIVMHGADYVSEDYINTQGYIGRSWGCPAIALDFCHPIIDMVKEGTCLYIYHPSLAAKFTKKNPVTKKRKTTSRVSKTPSKSKRKGH